MEFSAVSNSRARYDELVKEICDAEHSQLGEGGELHQRVVALFGEVVYTNSSDPLAHDCGRLLNRFHMVEVVPESVDERSLIRTIYATESQYQDGPNSSCTSCAQAFLRNVLPLGIAWDLQTEQITEFVRIGKALYFALLKIAEHNLQEDRANLGQSFIMHQAFSIDEVASNYGIKVLGAHEERALGGEEFFKGQLEQLEAWMTENRRDKIGATIHCQEKTFALAIFNTSFGKEYVFFDSHGNCAVNGPENPHAYVKYTFDRNAMAEVLSGVLPFHRVEVPDLTASAVEQIEREQNPYILYRVEVAEKGFLAETPPRSPGGSDDDLGSSFVHLTSGGEATAAGNGEPVATTPVSSPRSEPAGGPQSGTGGLETSSFVVLPGGEPQSASAPQPSVTPPLEPGKSPGKGSGEGGGGASPSRIHRYAIGLFIFIVAAAAYKYRKPIMQQITSFTTKFGITKKG